MEFPISKSKSIDTVVFFSRPWPCVDWIVGFFSKCHSPFYSHIGSLYFSFALMLFCIHCKSLLPSDPQHMHRHLYPRTRAHRHKHKQDTRTHTHIEKKDQNENRYRKCIAFIYLTVKALNVCTLAAAAYWRPTIHKETWLTAGANKKEHENNDTSNPRNKVRKNAAAESAHSFPFFGHLENDVRCLLFSSLFFVRLCLVGWLRFASFWFQPIYLRIFRPPPLLLLLLHGLPFCRMTHWFWGKMVIRNSLYANLFVVGTEG